MARKPKSVAAAPAGLTYLGPVTGFDDGKVEVLLVRGRTYPALPVNHPVIVGLLRQKLLVPPPPEVPAEPPAEPAAGDDA